MSNKDDFIKSVERLVNPIEVGSIHFIHGLNRLLPRKLQDFLSKNAAKKSPYLGFVVEPYSFFLSYKIKDINKAQELLPDGFELAKTSLFDNEEKYYCAIVGNFRVHTSTFWGSRTEFYVIARNKISGLLSWVIIDYMSNTIGQDKKNGLRDPNSKDAVITINHRGRLFVDIKDESSDNTVAFSSDITKGLMNPLDQELWIDGNLSVAYGKDLKGSAKDVLTLQFQECEMEKALNIPMDALQLEKINWFSEVIDELPTEVACFPFAQHYLADSPGHKSMIKSKEELANSISKLDFSNIKAIVASNFRGLVFIQSGLVLILFTLLIIVLFLKT